MKKIILILVVALSSSIVCSAESPVAQKIVNTLQGAGEPCKTPDGKNGRFYPQTKTTTTTTTTTTGTNRNSGSNATTVSNGVNASLTGAGISAGSSTTSSSGTTSQSNSTTTTVTTTTTGACVPYNNK